MHGNDALERLAATSPDAAGRLASVEMSISAGFMAPLHAHEADEAVHLVEGQLTIYADGATVRLGPGETLVVERGMLHTFRAGPARARAVFTTFTRSPARYENFLRAAGPVAPDAGWAAAEDEATVTAIAAAARIELLGPPGTLPPARRAA
jgi:quercetin dioxygenase-like cupin family protein